jgi:hypothetical protein
MVMTIHIPQLRVEDMGYNCHIHALVADGLFTGNGKQPSGCHILPRTLEV